MLKVKCIIAYDGTSYKGWQKTITGPSIQGELEKVLSQILQEPISLEAASRTDAGVHASGQVACFQTPNESLDLSRLKYSANCLLPQDIAIMDIAFVPETFHPTLGSIEKEYRYFVCYSPVQWPQSRLYSWHYPYRLDIPSMREASLAFVGQHNFATFCNRKKNEGYNDYTRFISSIEIIEMNDDRLCIAIRGKQFLYKMVRNIVGTLVSVGRGIIEPNSISYLLQEGNRSQAGITAPAHGLTLQKVVY